MKLHFISQAFIVACLSTPAFSLPHAPTTPVNTYGDPVLQNEQQVVYGEQYFLQAKQKPAVQVAATAAAVETKSDSDSGELPTKVLQIAGLKDAIGYYGAHWGDYNGDNNQELLLVQGNQVALLNYSGGGYKITELMGTTDYSIRGSVLLKDTTSDVDYLYIQSYDNKVTRLNLLTQQVEVLSGITRSSSIYAFVVGGKTQLLSQGSDGRIRLFDSSTGELLSESSDVLYDAFVVGSFTKVGSQQLLTNNGRIFDFENGQLELVRQSVLRAVPDVLKVWDYDGDGLDEVLDSSSWSTLRLMSPATDSQVWIKTTSNDIARVQVADINNDGKDDVIYADGQWGSLHALSAQDGTEFWSIANPDHGVASILVGDFDQDGATEIAWGAGNSSSGPDHLYIHDFASKELEWRSESLGFPADAVKLADLNGDGTPDVVVGFSSTDSGYGPSKVMAFDGATQALLWSQTLSDNWGRALDLAVADLDLDGAVEIVVGGAEIYDANIIILSGADGSSNTKAIFGSGDVFSSLVITDLDGDSFPEIVTNKVPLHTGSDGPGVQVINGQDLSLNKTALVPSGGWGSVAQLTTMDVSATEGVDIFGLNGNSVLHYQYDNNSISLLTHNLTLTALASALIHGEPVLVGGDINGNLYKLGLAGEKTLLGSACVSQLNRLKALSGGRVLFSCNDSFGVFNLEQRNQQFSLGGSSVAGKLDTAVADGIEYYLSAGSAVTLYSNQAAPALDTPAAQTFNTHVLSPVTVELGIDADYVVIEGQPKLGNIQFIDRKAGKFIYTPKGIVGTEQLSFYLAKGVSVSAPASLEIDVTNQAPVAENLSVSTHWNGAFEFTLPGSDADAEPLTFVIKSAPAQGELTLIDASSGTVRYIPSGNSTAAVSFSYTVKDSLLETAQKNVIVQLTNTTPVATDISYSSYYETPVNGALKGSDADGDNLTYQLVTSPTTGVITLDEQTGLFEYKAAGEQDQQISFTYLVKDKFASSEAKTVSIKIKGKPSDSGSSNWWLIVLVAGLGWVRHRRFRSA
ncbi:Ig-like domain-containing protein [Rheinheimera sp.]|uniref:FG-GAP repeat domain-containing protein n=1 Tax=Rheinheimera sp. TaxID=1869214 RepID=UPI00307F9FD4